jgi:hypothetical protein
MLPPDAALILEQVPELAEADREQATQVLNGADSIALELDLLAEPEVNAAPFGAPVSPELSKEGKEDTDIRTKISKMTLPQKLKLALFGNGVVRGLLVRDSNKLIQLAVLKNPRIQLPEIEEFAKSSHLSEAVLRVIANTDSWMKSYRVKHNLVMNPKAPIDISLKWLKFLNHSDVRAIARSKNVPQVLATAARKKVASEEDKR